MSKKRNTRLHLKRVQSMALAVIMLLSICLSGVVAHAEESPDGLCVHHPEHTAECGYVKATEGSPCTHVHDESCGYAEATEEIPCNMGCTDTDGNGVIDHVEACAYQPSAEASPCTHVHDESCGYAEAKEGSPCIFAVEGCPSCVVSWEWADGLGALVRDGDGWTLAAAGASGDAPLTRGVLESMLPAQLTATTGSGEEVTLDLTWDLSSFPEGGASSGTYRLTASLAETQENYALTADAAPLEATVQLGGAELYDSTLPSDDPPYPEHIVQGVSPNGTTINLFDYWLEGQDSRDTYNPKEYYDLGINKDHALLFTYQMQQPGYKGDPVGNWNGWTRGTAPYTGMVQNTLVKGYPVLNLGTIEEGEDTEYVAGRNGQESLAYLFDPDMQEDGKASYENVQGLLQVDDQGYYYYDSMENYAVYYENTNSFVLYDHPGVQRGNALSPKDGQFFPFNEANEDPDDNTEGLMRTNKSTAGDMNHYFGIHMSTRFVQQNNGHVDENQTIPVTYEFSGDDDVWIFIDGKLAVDLGGLHNRASVTINFDTGKIVINETEQSQTLGEILGTGSHTLPNDTYHTLDFFYLERGNTDSNLLLKYNLITIPESDLIKVDQLGDPVEGAEFTLYAADDTDRSAPIATGTTDEKGGFIFQGEDAYGNFYPITIDQLYSQYNSSKDSAGNNLILVETYTPAGYRSVGEVGLYFYKPDSEEVLLLSNNVWDKGAYAMPKVTTTTGSSISLLETATGTDVNSTVDLVGSDAVENPVMFAVVFQKQSDGTTWLPVSGDPLKGWMVWADNTWSSVLGAAQASHYVFQLASSGAYQVEIENLPGDIKTYYHICQNVDKAQYTIAYYYTKAGTLTDAAAANTWRIDAENADNPLDRVFSMDMYVTNIKNYLLVQKVDGAGNAVNGVSFSLYKADDVTIADDGTVTVHGNTGAYDSLTTADVMGILNLEGGGVFPTTGHLLELGEYYLIETSAPNGYRLNDTAVHVIVDNTGVYADAGTEDDGVTVLRGVGSVMRSIVQFAVNDGVDTTLQGIKAALATSITYNGSYNENGSFTVSGDRINWDSAGEDVLHLQYANDNSMLDYGLYDTSIPGTIDSLTLATETGWSKLLIQQCYQHNSSVDTSLKSNLVALGYADITNLFSGTCTVRVTNEQVGSLTVSKTVTGTAGEQDKEWNFTVTLTGADAEDVDGTYGDMTFANGVATFTLKHNESKTAADLPAGLGYQVIETEDGLNGYTTSSTGATGTIQMGQTASAAFINTRTALPPVEPDTGSLTVSKMVTGTAGNQSTAWTFTLELKDSSGAALTGSCPYTGGVLSGVSGVTAPDDGTLVLDGAGKATFTLTHGQSITITDLPAGATYAVTEAEDGADGYTTSTSGTAGTIEKDKTKTAAFTNHKDSPPPVADTGSLLVSKEVTGTSGEQDREWTFTVTLTGTDAEDVNGTYGEMTFADGVATFTLKHNESKTAADLPAGLGYQVTEAEAGLDGYTTTFTEAAGIIEKGQTKTAAFTNHKGSTPPPHEDGDTYGKLTISKTVTGDGDRSKIFTFTVTFTTGSGSQLENRFSYTGSKSGMIKSGQSITLRHGQSITIAGIPSGTKYTVTEAEAEGYTTAADGDIGTIPANGIREAAFVNAWTDPDEPDTPPDEPDTPPDEPDTPPDEPDTPPDEPDIPPDEPDTLPDEPDTPAVPEVPSDPNTPQTGDNSLTALWALLSAGSLAGLFWLVKKKLLYQGKHIRK